MKKWPAILLVCLLLTGCATHPAESTEPTTAQTEPETIAPATEPETTPETTAPAATEIPLNIFVPNENADGFETIPTVLDTADGDAVLAQLIEHSMLNEDITLNSIVLDGRQLNLDFNQAFADQLLSCGTAGERMLMGCVVNTYLSVFDADSVYITVNGEILESGHVVYDFPMEFFE